MGRPAVPCGPREPRRGARDRVALRRARARRSSRSRRDDADERLARSAARALGRDRRSSGFPAACTALLELRPVEIRDAQNDARVPAELAADLAIASVRFEPLRGGHPGRHAVDRAGLGGGRPASSTPCCPVVAAAVARVVEPARAPSARGAEAEFLLELADEVAAAEAARRDARRRCASALARAARRTRRQRLPVDDGRLEPAVTRLAGGPRDPAETEAFLSAHRSAARRARAAVQAGRPVRASGADSPLIGPIWARALERRLRCSRSRSRATAARSASLVLDDSDAGPLHRRGRAHRRGGRRAHAPRRSSRRAIAEESLSQTARRERDPAAAPGGRRRRVGQRGGGDRRPRRARDARRRARHRAARGRATGSSTS